MLSQHLKTKRDCSAINGVLNFIQNFVPNWSSIVKMRSSLGAGERTMDADEYMGIGSGSLLHGVI